MKSYRFLHTISCTFLSLTLLCACGGGDPENIGPSPSPVPTPTPTPTPSEPAALKVTEYNETDLHSLKIPYGNFSGITYLGNNKYAIADDYAYGAGFIFLTMEMNSNTGKIISAERTIPKGTDMTWYETGEFDWTKLNDAEGIVYVPKTGTIFVANEEPHQDPNIKEYDLDGIPTGREMDVPRDIFTANTMQEIYGFESLAYNEKTGLFWTTTENTLIPDKKKGEKSALCRLQSFGEDLKASDQYLYRTDEYEADTEEDGEGTHIWGVSDMVALDDGQLIVMEREFYASGFWCKVKLFSVDPTSAKPGEVLKKTLLTSFKNDANNDGGLFSDYEGMCLGPKLKNGEQTLLLIADSQNGKGAFGIRLHDALKVLVIE